jgi:hypothetical protein
MRNSCVDFALVERNLFAAVGTLRGKRRSKRAPLASRRPVRDAKSANDGWWGRVVYGHAATMVVMAALRDQKKRVQ